MAAEARVNEELLLLVGPLEFEEEDARGEVVDVVHAEPDERSIKLVRYYLWLYICQRAMETERSRCIP